NTTGGPTGLQIVSISGSVSGCTADNQCGSTQFCNTQAASCLSKLPNGTLIPTLSGHTPALNGMCATAAVGAAVCSSAVCDMTDNECGYANGDGTCTPSTATTVCRSQTCSLNGKCVVAGGCNVDGDCAAGEW